MLTIRRVTTKGGTVLRCGLTGRFACATAKVRTGVRTIPMWIRIRSNPVPGTAKRTVSVQLQRLEKGTYVKRGGGTIDLPSTGVLDIQVPAATRGTVSYWRWRLYAPASKTTLFARSAWFYVRVK
jgi:hypothetical protein